MLKKIKSVSYYVILILVLFNTIFTLITITNNNKNKRDLLNFNAKDILTLNEKDKYLRVEIKDLDNVIIDEENLKPFKIDFNSVYYGFHDEDYLFIRYSVKYHEYGGRTVERFIGQVKTYRIEDKKNSTEIYYVIKYSDFLALTKWIYTK